MNKHLQKIIEGLGFDDKEANVYLACLELDGASNAEIARKTRLNRITNYEILKRLQQKGVIASFKKRGGKHFVAIDPRIVIRQAKEKIAMAEENLPQLSAIANKLEKKPKVYFFEGMQGIKSLYEDALSAQTEILTFTNPKDLYTALSDLNASFVAERVKRKIIVRGIVPDDEFGVKSAKEGGSLLRYVHFFDKTKYPIRNEIMIYDDKVVLYSLSDGVGLIIENAIIANTLRSIWRLGWDSAQGNS